MTYFTREKFNELWGNSTIILDTSVLGLILQSNPEQAKIMMDLFLHWKSNIWIPAQVKNEIDEILQNPRIKNGAADRLNKFHNKISEQLFELKEGLNQVANEMLTEGHNDLVNIVSGIDVNRLFYSFLSDFQISQIEISRESLEFINQGAHSSFFDAIMENTGVPFTDAELNEVIIEGKARYENTIPPGYLDKSKKGKKQYGDLIIWKQLLRRIGLNSGYYTFITADKKNDWFELDANKAIISPRRELLKEFSQECPNAEICIVYFLDYIQESSDHFFRNQNELIMHIDKDSSLREEIVRYIEDNLFSLIEDSLQSIAADYKGSAQPDIVEDISVSEAQYEGEGQDLHICYDVDATCVFEYALDIHDSFDEPGDSGEMSTIGYAQVKSTIRIPIGENQCEYSDNHFILDADEWEVSIDEVRIMKATEPFEDEDDDEDEDDEDFAEDFGG